LTYKLFADKNIITKDVKQYPQGLPFKLNWNQSCLVRKLLQFSVNVQWWEVYYISSAPSAVSTNEVLNMAQALSKPISASKIASNRPRPMDLCARFVNSLIPDISECSVSHTPNMKGSIWEMSTY
jgi:hypothetical protein